jgi:TNF receptor-associated factor 4
VTDNHWPICPCRSVPCPNECGKYLVRKNLEAHQASECLLAVVKCSFDFAGCKVEIPRKEMAAHITESLADHISLQAISHQKQLKELQADISELKAENQKLKDTLDEQSQKFKDQLDEQNQKIATLLRNPSVRSSEEVTATVSPKVEETRGDQNVAPVIIVFKDFQQHTIWWSPPFYTHPQGYKMCLKVFPNGNRSGENTHMSVYINIMKGEFDDRLLWPFRGDLTIRLLRNNSETWYYEKVISFTERIHPRVSGRVVKGDKLIQGFGIDQFIPQDSLTSSSGYIQDNSLRFRILTSQVHGFSWVTTLPGSKKK